MFGLLQSDSDTLLIVVHRAQSSVLVRTLSKTILTIIALLVIVGCGENTSSQVSDAVATNDTVVDPSETPSPPPEDIVGTTLEGNTFSLRTALADKPVVLWFWSPG